MREAAGMMRETAGSRGREFREVIKFLGAPRELKSPCDGGVGGFWIFLLPLVFIQKRPILFRKKRDEKRES